MDDGKIINLYIERSEDAIKETDIKYGGYCKIIANNIVGNVSDTEECVNDTYLKMWNTIPPTIPNVLKAYIGRITRNFALMKYRESTCAKRGGGEISLVIEEIEEFLPAVDSVDTVMESNLVLELVNKLLLTVPEENRKIFVRRYWYAQSVANIAKAMGITESKVKSVLFRIRNKLKEELAKEDIYVES